MITVGLDPDLRASAIAVVDDGRVVAFAIPGLPRSMSSELAAMTRAILLELGALKGRGITLVDRGVVEGQRIYMTGVAQNPDSILRLAQVPGAAAAAALMVWPSADLAVPRPSGERRARRRRPGRVDGRAVVDPHRDRFGREVHHARQALLELAVAWRSSPQSSCAGGSDPRRRADADGIP